MQRRLKTRNKCNKKRRAEGLELEAEEELSRYVTNEEGIVANNNEMDVDDL